MNNPRASVICLLDPLRWQYHPACSPRGHSQIQLRERMTTIMHELTHIQFPSILGTVLCAGDTLAVKRTDKESCSHEAYILLGKKDN